MIKFFKTDKNSRMEQLVNYSNQCWIDLVNPTDDEVEDACSFSGMPEEMVKAALDEEESARVETDEGCTMFIVDSPAIIETNEGDTYTTIPVSVLYNEKCLMTVSLHGNPVLSNFISNRGDNVTTDKPILFLLSFMLQNAKRFSYFLKQIDKKSVRLQAELHKSMKNQELIQLLGLENSLVYFSTSLNANTSVYGRMARLAPVVSNEEYQDLYDDVIIETKQAIEMCNIYRDVLKTTMDAFSSVISNNVNNIVKKLTLITIVVAIPTLIAGLLGMNVVLPFNWGDLMHGPWAFWLVIGISVVLTTIISIVLFKMTNSVNIKTPKTIKSKRRP